MSGLRIGGRIVDGEHPAYVIAEIGNNHNGDPQKAEDLIRAAAAAGADAVKLQTWRARDIHNPSVLADAYRNFDASDRFKYWVDFVATLELDYGHYDRLVGVARECGVDFCSTPASIEALQMLVRKSVPLLKVASMDLTNQPFLAACAQTGLPVILSTGMATIEEIDRAVSDLGKAPHALLHCVSNYPTRDEDARLLNIAMLAERYQESIVGFSSHSEGIDLEIAARALGALIFEKHFTLDRNDRKLAEHHVSLEPKEFAAMVRGIRRVERALGGRERILSPEERESARLARRSVVPIRDLQAGDVLGADDLRLIRPGTGIPPREFDRVLGRKAKRHVTAFSPLRWEDLE